MEDKKETPEASAVSEPVSEPDVKPEETAADEQVVEPTAQAQEAPAQEKTVESVVAKIQDSPQAQQAKEQLDKAVVQGKNAFDNFKVKFENDAKTRKITYGVVGAIIAIIVLSFLLGPSKYKFEGMSFSTNMDFVEEKEIAAEMLRDSKNSKAIAYKSSNNNISVIILTMDDIPEKEMKEMTKASTREFKKVVTEGLSGIKADFAETDGAFMYGGGFGEASNDMTVGGYVIFDVKKSRLLFITMASDSDDKKDLDELKYMYESVKYSGTKLHKN